MVRLFPDWRGELTLPPSPLRKERIGSNTIYQQAFRGVCTNAEAEASADKGYYLIRTPLTFPFNKILLRFKGVRRVATDYLTICAPELEKLYELGPDTLLEWDNLNILNERFCIPAQILDSWKGKFFFSEENIEEGTSGLRPPQMGALHAISAHYSVDQFAEPATIVLPTGTGKTETMLSFQVYKRLPKTLVIVPSDALRNQVLEKFLNLGILSDVGIVSPETIGPSVARIKSGLHSKEEAHAIADKSNVLIALPQSLNASTPEALNVLVDSCSDLIVDEAHHITAPQWSRIRQMFFSKRITQFTATPFRRDNKRVDGKIIFNYKLGDAQEAGYYRPINLRTIEEFGDEEARDRKIAEEALAVLRHDCNELHLDHILMARCETKDRAEKVFRLYQHLAPEMNPQLVYSGPGRAAANKEALEKIINRDARISNIVVCVDMLGEGFDLPNLKVAALHDVHKSLAITLQFIGRFTRKGNWEQIGEATVIANIADPDTEKGIESLYAEGADWDNLIKRFSEERIDQEMNLQNVIYSLREKGDLHTYLSLWNLKPALSTQIFKTQSEKWKPENYISVLTSSSKHWHDISDDNNLLVAVIHDTSRVRWGNYQELLDHQYYLLMARWDSDNKALFIYASDYERLKSTSIAKAITDDRTELLQGPVIFNILNNVELPLVKNLGSSRIGAISFTSYFGPNVTEGLAMIEKAQSVLNNIACVGYENGDRVLWGGTQKKGKVWQHASGTIAQWIDWTKKTWDKVSTEESLDVANITNNFLRPHKINEPYPEYPISVQWGEQIQSRYSEQFIVFGAIEVPLYLIEIRISDVKSDGEIIIQLSYDAASSEYGFLIDGSLAAGYRYKKMNGPDIYFQTSKGARTEICEYFVIDPVIVRYSDGTQSYNCYHIPTNLDAGEYPRDQINTIDWSAIPLNKESMGKTGNTNTIQYRSYRAIADEYDIVFNDDGNGEAGDLVCLKDIDEGTIKLCLVHCKGALQAKISNDIRNFYTVCGQAQTSITIKHLGMNRLYNNLKRRNEIWERAGYSRFLKGDIRKLTYFKNKARRAKLQFEVVIVQPGGSKSKLSSDILKLLGTTELFIKTTTQGTFSVVTSQ